MPPCLPSPWLRLALSMLAAMLLIGCGAREEPWESDPPTDANSVAILEVGNESLNADADAILREAFPNAVRLRAEQLVTAGPRMRQESTVLVVPSLASLTASHWAQLTNHIHRGGTVLFWGVDPGVPAAAVRLTMLRPASEYYEFSAREIRGLEGGMIQTIRPLRFQSSFPRARDSRARWIPLAEAREPSGHPRGWPAAVLVEMPSNGPLQAWGWIGWAPNSSYANAQRVLLQRAARQLANRTFLLDAGLDRAALAPGDPIDPRVELVSTSTTTPLRLAVELEDADGVITRRFTETIAFPTTRTPILQVSTTLVLGTAPRTITQSENVRLRFLLYDLARNLKLDEQVQRVRLMADTDASADAPDERLGVRGASFIIGRRPITLLGARFDPLLAGATGEALDIRQYDPALAARELDVFREAGFNLVEVGYTRTAQAPQLRHLLDLMRERQLWAIVQMPALSPWAPNFEEASDQLAMLRLSRGHRVFAVAVNLSYPERNPAADAGLQRAWVAWLEEQYGNLTHARESLGADPLDMLPAPDASQEADAPIAVRRAIARFFHDYLSRHLRHCRRALEHIPGGILLTALQADQYPIPPDLHHADFITRTLPARLTPFAPGEVEFRTAHARGISGGRPVLWRFGGIPLAYPIEPSEMQRATAAIQQLGGALACARAAGLLYGAVGGGPRPPDGCDAGLVNPDMTWRPIGDAWRASMHEWRRMPAMTPIWRGREADVWTEIAWTNWSERVASEAAVGLVEEMRPIGWGRETREIAVGGSGVTHGNSFGLIDFVNAEWLAPATVPSGEPHRARVRNALPLVLLNTGAALWSPSVTGQVGAVWVRARSDSGRTQFLPVRETAPGTRASLVWTPADAGMWTLRAWLHPTGEFGEALRVWVE